MRKVVFGKYVYDSDNAETVYDPRSSWYEELMQTPDGRLFKFGGGGMEAEFILPCSLLEGVEFILEGPDPDEVKVAAIRKMIGNVTKTKKMVSDAEKLGESSAETAGSLDSR